MDPTTRLLTGETFSLKYHDVEGVLDFLVLQQDFDLAIQRTWQPGDRFRSLINDGYGVQMWWEGEIVEREPFNKQYPNSMFLCFRIRFVATYFLKRKQLVVILRFFQMGQPRN